MYIYIVVLEFVWLRNEQHGHFDASILWCMLMSIGCISDLFSFSYMSSCLVIMFLLYANVMQCGFFRRKRNWKSEPKAEVEVADQPDNGNASGTDKGLALEDEKDEEKMEKKTPEGSITEKDEIQPIQEVPMSDV